MQKIVSILILLSVFSFNTHAQKYVKYFFNQNQVRILAEKSMVKLTDSTKIKALCKEDIPEKLFAHKSGKIMLAVYLRNGSEADMNAEMTLFEKKLATNNFKQIGDRKHRVQSKRKVHYFEYLDNSSYHLHFFCYFEKDSYYEFVFKSPVQKNKKWQPIAFDILKSLEVK